MYLSTIRIHALYIHKNVCTYKARSYVFSSLEGMPDEREGKRGGEAAALPEVRRI
jgi:hypothetical protein